MKESTCTLGWIVAFGIFAVLVACSIFGVICRVLWNSLIRMIS